MILLRKKFAEIAIFWQAFASVSAARIRAELYWNLGVGFMLSFFGHPRGVLVRWQLLVC